MLLKSDVNLLINFICCNIPTHKLNYMANHSLYMAYTFPFFPPWITLFPVFSSVYWNPTHLRSHSYASSSIKFTQNSPSWNWYLSMCLCLCPCLSHLNALSSFFVSLLWHQSNTTLYCCVYFFLPYKHIKTPTYLLTCVIYIEQVSNICEVWNDLQWEEPASAERRANT